MEDIASVVGDLPEDSSQNDVYTALADEERRHLLRVLQQAETSEPLSGLTRSLAVEMGRSGSETVQGLHMRLHHSHLPKLNEAGLVVSDEDQETVELTEFGLTIATTLQQ